LREDDVGKAGEPKARRKSVATTPINFRMPKPLRTRLDRFARDRHLGEAQALRVVVAEHLDEIESAAELAAADRWQYEQAFATWERFRRDQGHTVPREEIDRIFQAAREPAPAATTSRTRVERASRRR
jgi:predicted DNA-binding protein